MKHIDEVKKVFAGPFPVFASAYVTSDEFLDFNLNFGFQIIITKHVFLKIDEINYYEEIVLARIFSMQKI